MAFPTGNVEVRKDDKGRLHVYVDGTFVQGVKSVEVEFTHPDAATVKVTLLGRFVKLKEESP
jgi:hypothetical protein